MTTPTPEPQVVTPAVLRAWPLPAPGSDKEARGRVLVVGGTRGTPGAVRLAGEASLRSGGGKLQIVTVGSTATQLALEIPEARVVDAGETPSGDLDVEAADSIVDKAADCAAVLLGPGLVDTDHAVRLLGRVVPRLATGVVVDALASAYVTENPGALRHLGGRGVLTVNPTELARTLGWDEDEVDGGQTEAARALATRTGAVVLCGGQQKSVADPSGRTWLVRGGGPGLGVSGSGDVQAGIVSGLLARGAEPAQAAVWGAAVHARAGDRLASRVAPLGFLARELLEEVPAVLAELSG